MDSSILSESITLCDDDRNCSFPITSQGKQSMFGICCTFKSFKKKMIQLHYRLHVNNTGMLIGFVYLLWIFMYSSELLRAIHHSS